jgi:haloacetate dehalogenase
MARLNSWAKKRSPIYQHAIHDPHTVQATIEDHRAGLGIDRAHDEEEPRPRSVAPCLATTLLLARTADLDFGSTGSVA